MGELGEVLSLGQFESCVVKTLGQVTLTKDPIFVAVHERAAVVIADLEEYRELVRLAEIGLTTEIVERAAHVDACNDAVPWDDVLKEWQDEVAGQTRSADG